jgi:hypothetical protein
MNGTAHQQRRNQRLLDGRIEKRLPVSLPIYLAHLNELRAREQTVTENVSPHGARILSKGFWRPGEKALIARTTGEFLQVGRVVYNEQKMGCLCLGVEFLDRSINWGKSFPPLGPAGTHKAAGGEVIDIWRMELPTSKSVTFKIAGDRKSSFVCSAKMDGRDIKEITGRDVLTRKEVEAMFADYVAGK